MWTWQSRSSLPRPIAGCDMSEIITLSWPTGKGASEIALRTVVAALFCLSASVSGTAPLWTVMLGFASGLALYILWPKARFPAGTSTMHRGSAVIGPDIIGVGLLALFVALPVWIGRAEGAEGLHGSALLIWPLLPAPLALLFVAASNACFGLWVGPAGLSISSLRRTERIGWDEIIGWRPWRRDRLRVFRAVAPFLPPGAAGAVLLARASTGVEIVLRTGRSRRLPREGFENGLARVQRALTERGLPRLEPAH